MAEPVVGEDVRESGGRSAPLASMSQEPLGVEMEEQDEEDDEEQ